jgi:HPt (histidine-containing phosphotransfer) domain-containing protein
MSDYAPEVSPELLAGFLDEAPEYLSILDEGLMAFEEKAGAAGISLDVPEDQARMNEMFRAAHSLKGLGAALGFNKLRDLTHLMETLFDQLRMGKRQLDPRAIETLFAVFDKLKELVQELSDPPLEPVAIDDALASLQMILQSQDQRPAAAPDLPAGNWVIRAGGTLITPPPVVVINEVMFNADTASSDPSRNHEWSLRVSSIPGTSHLRRIRPLRASAWRSRGARDSDASPRSLAGGW